MNPTDSRSSKRDREPSARFWARAARHYGSARDFGCSLLEGCPSYFMAIDEGGKIVYMNTSMRARLGREVCDVEGAGYVTTLVPKRDRKGAAEQVRAAFCQQGPTTFEGTVLSKGGTERAVHWHVCVTPGRDGSARMLLASGIDVTEDREARRRVERERNEAYRYVELAGVMLVAIGSDERISLVNAKACEILGAPEEEIIGRNWFDTFLPERDRTVVRQWFRQLVAGEAQAPEHAENRIVTTKGEERLIEWHNTVLTDARGNVTGSLSSGFDVTERRRAEQIQQLTYQIANAIHTAPDTPGLFRTIQLELGKVINTENFFIALYDKSNDTISLPYFVDKEDQGKFSAFPAGKTMTAYVLRNNTSVLLTRKEADRWIDAGIIEMIGTPSQVWLGVPLRVKGEVIGALVVQSYTDSTEFGEAAREMLEYVSSQIGFAIEHKRAEEELKASEGRNRAILEAVPDLMFQLDRRGVFLSYDAPPDGALALPPEQFLGKSAAELFEPNLGRQIVESVVQALETGRTQFLEYSMPIPTPGGDLRDFEARFAPCGADTVLTVVREITERRRAEKFLRALNDAGLALEEALTTDQALSIMAGELKQLGLTSIVWLVDEDGKTVSIRDTSLDAAAVAAAEKMSGCSASDHRVRIDDVAVFRRLVTGREAILVERSNQFIREVVPSLTSETAQEVLGTLHVRERIYAPLVAEDRVTGILGILSDDLTEKDVPAVMALANQLAAALRKAALLEELSRSVDELKRTQDQLLQAQKMEAVGRLAGGVAHDFNNLLTAISGYAELLLSRPGLDEQARGDIGQIGKAGDQAAALTRQLLAFSRRQPLEPQVMDLNTVVVEMDAMLRRLIGEDIELFTALDRAKLEMEVDPGQIEQVIINLVVNARDAMPEGGRLTLRTKAIRLSDEAALAIHEARPGRFVCLAIEDTGCGIQKDVVTKIFEPFFSTKGPGKGTGLGLSVVYGIIRQHGGWVNVYSEPGHGAVFKVYLPVSQGRVKAKADEKPVPVKSLQGGGERILVVEDEEAVREFAAKALRESGYVVYEARHADEALELFEKEAGAFELVFSDVVLPGQSGIKLVDDLLARNPDLHVLLSSGYTDQKSQWPAIQEKGIHFLQKPYTLPDLLGTIKDIIQAN